MRKHVAQLNARKQFLKGHERELFIEYYQTMGTARSYIKLVNYCVVQGWMNPRTGKKPTRMTCWFSLWRWAIRPENQEEAYKIYNQAMLDEGLFCSKETWAELLDERAKVALRDSDYVKWKEQQRVHA